MGDFDLASLEAEFDQEDDESISQALRMAAESALAHTSGGGAGRRIRTASPVGATSSRSAGNSSSGGGRGGSSSAAAAVADAPPAVRSKKASVGEAEVEGGRDTGFSSPTPEDEFEAFRRLEAEGVEEGFGSAAWGGDGGAVAGAGGVPGAGGSGSGAGADDDGDWGSLSLKAVGRKTVPVLKEYLDEQGVDYPSKIKKADLVDMVVGLLAE